MKPCIMPPDWSLIYLPVTFPDPPIILPVCVNAKYPSAIKAATRAISLYLRKTATGATKAAQMPEMFSNKPSHSILSDFPSSGIF